MTKQNNRDYIHLVWQNSETRSRYTVGELSKNGLFEFRYISDYQEAQKAGFSLLLPFANADKTYQSDFLFPIFSSRLPDEKRKDIKSILAQYDLEEYDDGFELLKRSGGRLPIDNLEFIDPILINGDEEEISKTFYLAGSSYYLACKGENCSEVNYQLNKDNKLSIEYDEGNKYDKNAIKVLGSNNTLIGYIPRCYNMTIKELIENRGYEYSLILESISMDNKCTECFKVTLTLKAK